MFTSFDQTQLGWDGWFEAHFQALEDTNIVPARIAVHHRGSYLVYREQGEGWAVPSGRLMHSIKRRSEWPTVGDWVALTAREGGR